MTALVVDDNQDLANMLSALLQSEGHDVQVAYSRSEGQLAADAMANLDFALLDLLLPDGDGVELLHGIKQRHPDATVAVMTGFVKHPLKRAAMDEGVAVLDKPFSFDRLLSLLGVIRADNGSGATG